MGIFGDIGRKLRDKLVKEKKPQAVPEENVYAPKLSDECYNILSSLFDESEPRPAASAESRSFARKIAELFGRFSRDVTLTSCRIIPRLYRWLLVTVAASSAAVFLLSFIGLPYLAFVLSGFSIIAVVDEILKKKDPLRRFFPTDDASNVHAVIEPEEDVQHTVIFSSHHDTAAVSRSEKGKLESFLSVHTAAAGMVALCLVSFIQSIVEIIQGRLLRFNAPGIIFAILLLVSFAASLSSLYLIITSGKSFTKGAGDNLSGVAAVTTLGHYFSREKNAGKGPRNTRLIFVSFDGEECGAQGSAAWYRENSHLLINPVNINFDGIYKEDDLVFLASDGNGFVSLSSKLASELSLIASSMGYRIPSGKMGLFGGETDAVSAAISGIAAATLTGMPPGVLTPAHTEEDTPDKVSSEALSRCLQVAIRYVEKLDNPTKEGKVTTSFLEEGRKYKLSRY